MEEILLASGMAPTKPMPDKNSSGQPGGNETARVPDRAEVLIIGGGITGISLATLLARNGISSVLIEKNDFTSGTSQASGMMIWGGLLYLKNLEFRTVAKFCRSRDRLIRNRPGDVAPRRFTYLVARQGGRRSWFMWCALQVYRALSFWKQGPVRKSPLDRLPMELDGSLYSAGWTYEEGFLARSDSHFGLRQLVATKGPLTARNHHEIESLQRVENGLYQVELRSADGTPCRTEVAKIVNCGGVWADGINTRFGVPTQHHHHFSKGVYLLLGASGDEAFVMDSGTDGDVLCWVPWGEITMWGPTETTIDSLDDAHATAADVEWLLAELNRRSTRKWTHKDIVNVRCGVRPLAVLPGTEVKNPLDLSRRAIIEKCPDQNWWTVLGGKLSGAEDVAAEIYQSLLGRAAEYRDSRESSPQAPMIRDFFDGREIPDPDFCRDHEFCRTLDDYLRRRSNIAQWIPRGGFGNDDEFAADLLVIATRLSGDRLTAEQALQRYREQVILDLSKWHPSYE